MKHKPNNDLIIYDGENKESDFNTDNRLNKFSHKSSFDKLVSNLNLSNNILDYFCHNQKSTVSENHLLLQKVDIIKDMSDYKSKNFYSEYELSNHIELKVDENKVM